MITPDFTHTTWRKSSHSGSNGGACVEIAAGGAVIGVRDSKNTAGPMLTFTGPAWRSFLIAR
ncbi:MAG TPA: DUF397 domain-containing protein [Pseudonocardiaceae bacterium]|jgi:hypothetical protein|nr:DUF397 domain-containing protein [Pseudonocardiaceae bacterium]